MTSISNTASQGGGVVVAVRSDFKSEAYANSKMSNLEAVCARIITGTCNTYIYCLYIQPTASIDIYKEHLGAIEMMLSEIKISDNVILLGDFNFGDAVEWDENDIGFDFLPSIGNSQSAKAIIARETTSKLLEFGLLQISNFKNKSVFTNIPELTTVDKAEFPLLPPWKSDKCHVPIMCTVECSPNVLKTTESDPVYCFKKADFELIREHLSTLDFLNIMRSSVDINEAVKYFYDLIYDTFEKFVPKSSIRSTNKPKWHNKQLSHLKNIRNKQFNKLCREREISPNTQPFINEQQFISAKENYESLRKQLFSDFLREQSSNRKNDPRTFWRHINSKRTNNSIPPSIKLDDHIATSDSDKANLFAEYFQTVYVKHAEDHDLNAFIENRSDTNCFNLLFTPESVHNILIKMDLSKGSGFDGVSSLFLRECAEFLAEPLCAIYSRSVDDGIYPELFKIGQITPIFKAGQRNNIKNYRGVNILPNLAKVFEKLIHNQLKLLITPRISKSQHGFLPNRNIETNLMEMTTLIHKAFEQNAQLDVFYADISKAFDCVDPSLLIRKLAKYPMSNKSLHFFTSYLNGRSQYVKCNGSKSNLFDVSSGVGQGTILGPSFFLVFFDDSDAPDANIDENIVSFNFADDKKKAFIIKNREDTRKLQHSIDQFAEWCTENGLSMNLSKCKIITFTHKKSPIINDYTINGQVIERVDEIRDLGVILDKKLNFNKHIEYVSNKAKAVQQFVKRQSFFFDTDIVKLLYTALVRSNLEFACSIWSPFHDVHKSTLESIQKQMVIWLKGDHMNRDANNYRLDPYVNRCKEVGFVTLARRRVNAAALFIHAIISGRFNSPSLRSQMDLYDGVRTLRNPEFIRLKFARTDASTYSSFNNACRIYNHAVIFIDPTLPEYEFKRKLLQLPDLAFGQWARL